MSKKQVLSNFITDYENNLSEEDILNELLIYCKINEGLKAIENGKTVTNEEMKKLILACWFGLSLQKKDVMNYIDTAKTGTEDNLKKYFLELINYIDVLNFMPYLGKKLNLLSVDLHIRQIIYKSHKIIYLVSTSNIYILSVLHAKMDKVTIVSKIIASLSNFS